MIQYTMIQYSTELYTWLCYISLHFWPIFPNYPDVETISILKTDILASFLVSNYRNSVQHSSLMFASQLCRSRAMIPGENILCSTSLLGLHYLAEFQDPELIL